MAVPRFLRFVVVAVLAAFASLPTYGQGQQCNSYNPGPSISNAFELGDGQGSSYYLVQVCGLQQGVSIVVNLLVQDVNTNLTLFNGQAPTDVNGVAHININSLLQASGGGLNNQLTVTSPGNPDLFYSTLSCDNLNCSSASLFGQFIFQFQGTTVEDSHPVQIAGTFLANGFGFITGGEADLNSANGVFEKVPLTGTYSYNATTGIGVINLSTPVGAQTFQVALNSSYEGALISSGGPLLGSGRLTPLSPNITIAPYFRYGSYSTEVSGTLPCNFLCELLGGASTVASTGILCLGCKAAAQPDSEPVYSVVSDQIAGGQPSFGVTQSGEAGPLDSFYRFVLINSSSSSNRTPTRYAAYLVSSLEMYLISLDPPDRQPSLSGTATQINP